MFGQVSGEARPEWLLRVDLTPTSDILRHWARWGDVQAIVRLLDRLLAPVNIHVSAILKDATLHLTCHSSQSAIPDKLSAIATVAPTLESLSPQGIRATTVYGVVEQEPKVRNQGSGSRGRGQKIQRLILKILRPIGSTGSICLPQLSRFWGTRRWSWHKGKSRSHFIPAHPLVKP